MTTSPRRWKTDLFLVVAAAVAALAGTLAPLPFAPLRAALVVPLVVLLPGYALVAALFPERRSPPDSDDMARSTTVTDRSANATGLLFSVRIALSVAASVTLVAGVAFVVTVVGLPLDGPFVALGVFALTLLGTAVAFTRRALSDPGERAGLPSLSVAWPSDPRTGGTMLGDSGADDTIPFAANALVVVGLVVFASSLGLAAVTTQAGGPSFTEVAVVTETADGEYVADDYPRTLDGGTSTPVTVALENHEGQDHRYTVVATLARLDRTPNGTEVTDRAVLSRTTTTVAAGETGHVEPQVRPAVSGSQRRLSFLVYRGDAPADPTRDNAYRVVHLTLGTGSGSESLDAPVVTD
ncbi:DUF1616 domain-containing protein [Salinirubrum litoreum]|uniref:DUF1616 domain-containing protein n=1 Tax=Salinirubrum litoreum TaxID=1126234 RepID=A0ABD5RCM9_9EURY|nr:DUF1616 domain-containing protein [Salinirubrum litoreum]